jgi:hypothetical protein
MQSILQFKEHQVTNKYMLRDDFEQINNDDEAFEERFKEAFEHLIREGLLIRRAEFDVKSGRHQHLYALTPKAYDLDCSPCDVRTGDSDLPQEAHGTNEEGE